MNELLGGLIIILFGFVCLFAAYLLIDMATEFIRGIIRAYKERKGRKHNGSDKH